MAVKQWLSRTVPGYAEDGEHYLGRSLLVTGNVYDMGLFSGDTGMVVATATASGSPSPAARRPPSSRRSAGRRPDRRRHDRAPGPGQPVRYRHLDVAAAGIPATDRELYTAGTSET